MFCKNDSSCWAEKVLRLWQGLREAKGNRNKGLLEQMMCKMVAGRAGILAVEVHREVHSQRQNEINFGFADDLDGRTARKLIKKAED